MSAVTELLTSFEANRKLTYDLIEELNPDDLHRPLPRPGLNTFAKHFDEMAAVQRAFVDGATCGEMNFENVPDVFAFEDADKEALQARLREADELMRRRLTETSARTTVTWDGAPLSIEKHLASLIAHEVFHQGMLAMAMYALAVRIPASWIDSWALPQSREG